MQSAAAFIACFGFLQLVACFYGLDLSGTTPPRLTCKAATDISPHK